MLTDAGPADLIAQTVLGGDVATQENKYEYLRRRAEADPGQRDTAIFALMPARPHPETRRNPTAEGWETITTAVGAVFLIGLLLAILGTSGSSAREIGIALVSGSVVGFVFIYADKHVDRARAHREHSSEARALLGSHERLRGLPADGLDLYAIDVQDSFLMNASFKGADLNQARFIGCNLRYADLTSASLVNTWIAFCAANHAKFGGANLRFSTCCFSDFRDANFSGADLTSAALYGSDFGMADLSDAVLISADLRGTDLSETTGLQSARIVDVNVDEWTRWPDGFTPPVRSS